MQTHRIQKCLKSITALILLIPKSQICTNIMANTQAQINQCVEVSTTYVHLSWSNPSRLKTLFHTQNEISPTLAKFDQTAKQAHVYTSTRTTAKTNVQYM